MNICDYTTLEAVRSGDMGLSSTTDTGQDGNIFRIIQSVAREIEALAKHRRFYPRIETRRYDVPNSNAPINFKAPPTWRELQLGDDLITLTTLTNGDGTVITSSQYKLYDANAPVKHKITLLNSSGVVWTPSGGDYEQAISAAGVWGYTRDYASAWQATGATLGAGITANATTFTCATGLVLRGELIQLDSEWLYVSSVTVSTTDTVTVVRGVNGSTAAAHDLGVAVYRYVFQEVESIARTATTAYWRLRNNPIGESVRIGENSFQTPKDVPAWIDKKLRMYGLVRGAGGFA